MWIRILLLLGLGLTGYYAFLRRNKVPVHIALLLGLVVLGAYFVISPDTTTTLARILGVDRGADLISYVVEVALFFIVIHYYTKFVDLESQVTFLTREIAFLRAEIETKPK